MEDAFDKTLERVVTLEVVDLKRMRDCIDALILSKEHEVRTNNLLSIEYDQSQVDAHTTTYLGKARKHLAQSDLKASNPDRILIAAYLLTFERGLDLFNSRRANDLLEEFHQDRIVNVTSAFAPLEEKHIVKVQSPETGNKQYSLTSHGKSAAELLIDFLEKESELEGLNKISPLSALQATAG